MKLTGESIMDNYSENSFLISGNSSINSSKHQTALTMYTQGEHNISSSTQILPDISPPVKIPQNNETLEIDHEDEFANVNFCTNTYNFSQLSNSPEYSIGNPSINQNTSTINNCRRVLPENVFNKNDTLPISPTPNLSMLRTNEHQITPPCIENSINLQQFLVRNRYKIWCEIVIIWCGRFGAKSLLLLSMYWLTNWPTLIRA